MNLPNKLTIGRLGITALFVVAMSFENYWAQVVALLLFIIASITDYYDGKIARENNLITDFGKLMDPSCRQGVDIRSFRPPLRAWPHSRLDRNRNHLPRIPRHRPKARCVSQRKRHFGRFAGQTKNYPPDDCRDLPPPLHRRRTAPGGR